MVRWTKADDTKLIKLLKDKTLNPNDTIKETVEKVRQTYFPEFVYMNFGPRYREKLRKWNIDKSLSGKRRGRREYFSMGVMKYLFSSSPLPSCVLNSLFYYRHSATDTAASAAVSSTCVTNPTKEARLHRTWNESEEEEEDDEIQEDFGHKSEDKKKVDEDEKDDNVEELVNTLEDIEVSAASDDMKIICPTFKYTYFDETGQQKSTVDFLLPSGTMANQVKPKVHANGMFLELHWTAPEAFFAINRLILTTKDNSKKKKVKMYHYKANAMALAVREIKANHNFEDIVCIQRVKLPFKVEQGLCTDDGPGSDFQLFDHDDGEMSTLGMGHLILSVQLVSTEKPPKTKQAVGSLHIIGSPILTEDNDDEGSDDEGEDNFIKQD